ncbi:hypothetical protein HMN09_00882700 [Mycena chlorophos]|uniref:Uncharacterized protein n=1 Tax=Mycena chlorophos TaxID=658473 RepID=A0A8H6W7V6_MYCCL|nr:hypothetical protein HMN09_00882700 [Mycena chlorophos]
MAPAAKQRRGWPPPVIALLSSHGVVSTPTDHTHRDDFVSVDLRPTPTTPTPSRRVPPQYSPDPNGIWRRIDSYTLVGSTICDTCATPPTSLQETDAAFQSSIPSGWIHTPVANSKRTSITIGLAVSLATLIFLTIIRCHFSMRAANRRRRDIEKQWSEKRARAGELDLNASTETLAPKLAPGTTKSRKWMAKATARWRENARYLARQRRGPRTTVTRKNGSVNSLPIVDSKETDVDEPPIPSSSRAASPTPSAADTLDVPDSSEPGPEPPLPEVPEPVAATSTPPEPPAYPKPVPAVDMADILSFEPSSPEAFFPAYTPRPAADEASSSDQFNPSGSSTRDTAHVATDDKALLAQLAERASAPEMRVSEPGTTAVVPREDDLEYEFEGFEWTPAAPGPSDAHVPPLLPSPPLPVNAGATSSGAVLEKMQLERAYAARDLTSAGPSEPLTPAALGQAQASAPPLEAGDIPALVASAPAFVDDDENDEREEPEWMEAGPSYSRVPPSASPPVEREDEEEVGLEYVDEVEAERRARAQAPRPPPEDYGEADEGEGHGRTPRTFTTTNAEPQDDEDTGGLGVG